MQVRLGFAVISSLDEPIFLVDEVLAVGDKAFREKCYTAHGEPAVRGPHPVPRVALREGPQALRHPRASTSQRGELVMDGPMDEVLARYNEDLAPPAA